MNKKAYYLLFNCLLLACSQNPEVRMKKIYLSQNSTPRHSKIDLDTLFRYGKNEFLVEALCRNRAPISPTVFFLKENNVVFSYPAMTISETKAIQSNPLALATLLPTEILDSIFVETLVHVFWAYRKRNGIDVEISRSKKGFRACSSAGDTIHFEQLAGGWKIDTVSISKNVVFF